MRFNHDNSWFLDTVSTVDSPAKVLLCKGDGSKSQVLAESEPRDVETHAFCPKQLFTIKARDGYPLDATLIKPLGFDPQKRYPIYLPTYSGPNAS